MSVLSWLRRVRVDLFSSSGHWADVMVEVDTLEADHDGRAQEAAEQAELAAREPDAKLLFRDVLIVLEGRGGAPPPEVTEPEPGAESKTEIAPEAEA